MRKIIKQLLISLLIMAFEEINQRNFRRALNISPASFVFTKPSSSNCETNKRSFFIFSPKKPPRRLSIFLINVVIMRTI